MIRYWSTGTKFVQYNFVFVFANRFIPLSREFVLICIAPVWSLVEVVAQYVSKVLRHNPTMPQKSLKSSLVSKIGLSQRARRTLKCSKTWKLVHSGYSYCATVYCILLFG